MTEFERIKANIKIMKIAEKLNRKTQGSVGSVISDYHKLKKEIEKT